MSTNAELSDRFARAARILELLGADAFRVNAHTRVARALEGLSTDVRALAEDKKALTAVEGIGAKSADKIIEFVKSGRIAEFEELAARVPAGLLALMELPGLGPKTVATLWREGGVTDAASLRRIIDDGTILTLPRMGEKTVEKIKQSLATAAEANVRHRLGVAMPLAESIVARLEAVPGVSRVAFAGSLRRGKETVGDVDILVETTDAAAASAAFVAMPGVRQVLLAGATKSACRFATRADAGRWGAGDAPEPTIQVDLRVVPAGHWGAAMMYFTGSKEHNVQLRQRAQRAGRTLNEYGLYTEDGEPTPPQARGVTPIAAATEEEVFAALGLDWVPPELREAGGEVDVFDRGGRRPEPRPDLVDLADIRAELHAHTTASDGSMEIEDLAARTKDRGFHTIAVTDHSRSSVQANGLSIDRLLEHVERVREARSKVSGITILAGSEVDILADGTLDYPDDVLRRLDVVVASPHTALSQDPDAATARLLAAIRHPLVHILGHPTGRLINRRKGLEPDIAKLVAAAAAHRTALEINSHWLRLDLRDVHVKAAASCLVAIDCDVHEPGDFDNLRYGVLTARRGWLTKERCVNTWPAEHLHEWLRSKR